MQKARISIYAEPDKVFCCQSNTTEALFLGEANCQRPWGIISHNFS